MIPEPGPAVFSIPETMQMIQPRASPERSKNGVQLKACRDSKNNQWTVREHMELRPDLIPPLLDESLVARLTELSEQIDCGHREQTREQLAAFNRQAMIELEFIDFQGIYGGQDHDTWVRKVLATPYRRRVADVTKRELIELARRVMECDGAEHDIDFWLSMLAINIPNERVSDLIYWPNEYFNDVNYSQRLSPEQVIEIALNDRDALL